MATIALRVATVTADQPQLASGHCYIIFSDPTITVRFLIQEKVRAELRKARAGGESTSSLNLLIGNTPGNGPLDEQMATEQAMTAFRRGTYLILVDGKPMVDLDAVISLTRRTGIVFLVTEADLGRQELDAMRAEAGIVITPNEHIYARSERNHVTYDVYQDGSFCWSFTNWNAANTYADELAMDLAERGAIGELTA